MEAPDAIAAGMNMNDLGPIIVGMIVAAVSGLVAIKTMIKVVSNKKLNYFSYYVWLLGIFVIIYGLFFA